jgi:hypothetical protein
MVISFNCNLGSKHALQNVYVGRREVIILTVLAIIKPRWISDGPAAQGEEYRRESEDEPARQTSFFSNDLARLFVLFVRKNPASREFAKQLPQAGSGVISCRCSCEGAGMKACNRKGINNS